jgi:hypothetical protein
MHPFCTSCATYNQPLEPLGDFEGNDSLMACVIQEHNQKANGSIRSRMKDTTFLQIVDIPAGHVS